MTKGPLSSLIKALSKQPLYNDLGQRYEPNDPNTQNSGGWQNLTQQQVQEAINRQYMSTPPLRAENDFKPSFILGGEVNMPKTKDRRSLQLLWDLMNQSQGELAGGRGGGNPSASSGPLSPLINLIRKVIPEAQAAESNRSEYMDNYNSNLKALGSLSEGAPKLGNPVEQLAPQIRSVKEAVPILGQMATQSPGILAKGISESPNLQRFNVPAQVNAVMNMSPDEARDFRGRVDNLLSPFAPQLPQVPNPYSQMPIPGSGLPIGVTRDMAQGLIDTPAQGAGGLAKLPAATTFGEMGGDILNVAKLVSLILGGLDLTKAATTSAPVAGKIVGGPMTTQAQQTVARPAHQQLIEQALQQNNMPKVAEIIKSIPANDPYRVSMIQLFGPLLQGAGISL